MALCLVCIGSVADAKAGICALRHAHAGVLIRDPFLSVCQVHIVSRRGKSRCPLQRHPYGHSIPLAGIFAARSAPCPNPPPLRRHIPKFSASPKKCRFGPCAQSFHVAGYRSVPLFWPKSRREQRHPGHRLNSLHQRMHPRHRRILPWLLCYYWAFITTR